MFPLSEVTGYMDFPYKKLTRIEANHIPGWSHNDKGNHDQPVFRYLWYELCSTPFQNENYFIAINAKSRPYKPGQGWEPANRRYEMVCYGGIHEPFFKLSLLAQLHILQQMPDTCGEIDSDKLKLAKKFVADKVKVPFK